MRPAQWLKNIFVLAPLFFSLSFLDVTAVSHVLFAVLTFILLSSSVYIINDICDIEEDKGHPVKKNRPLPAGLISVKTALYLSGFLNISAWLIAFALLPKACLVIMGFYFVLQLLYTWKLKHEAIIDVISIAAGFVLRVLMGVYAISVAFSPWIILTTFLLALFLAFGKRYNEYCLDGYSRKSLENYSSLLLQILLGISCAAALISYALYAVETADNMGKTAFVYTTAFVTFGLFRYLQVVLLNKGGGEPDRVLFRDPVFMLNGLLWGVSAIYILSS